MIKLAVFSIVLFLCAGCSSTGSKTTPPGNFPDHIVGNWFNCEFENASNCTLLDDDGISFTENGQLWRIQESTQESLFECRGSPCFSSVVAGIKVTQSPLGTYSYSGGQVSVSISGCNETSVLTMVNEEAFIQISNCDSEFDGTSDSNGSVLRKYGGDAQVVNSGQ